MKSYLTKEQAVALLPEGETRGCFGQVLALAVRERPEVRCSAAGWRSGVRNYRYYPNCGARMDGAKEQDE